MKASVAAESGCDVRAAAAHARRPDQRQRGPRRHRTSGLRSARKGTARPVQRSRVRIVYQVLLGNPEERRQYTGGSRIEDSADATGHVGRAQTSARVRRRPRSCRRQGEPDALLWADLDLTPGAETIQMEHQWNVKARKLTLPEHGVIRSVAMTPRARDRVLALRGTDSAPSSHNLHLEPRPLRRRARLRRPLHGDPRPLRAVRVEPTRARPRRHRAALRLSGRRRTGAQALPTVRSGPGAQPISGGVRQRGSDRAHATRAHLVSRPTTSRVSTGNTAANC